jgi:serine/threonine protein kinase
MRHSIVLLTFVDQNLGSLIERRRKHKNPFSTSEITEIAIELLRGIDYLHSEMQLLHRDLKSDNILVDIDEQGKINKIKLTDFGVCKFIRKLADDNTRVGTELFLAPEVHSSTQYSVASDGNNFRVNTGY